VASVFISRWDRAVAGKVPAELHAQLGIAIAKRTYHAYRNVLDSDRAQRLANNGARPQRLLWASTGTKNPAYSDVKYVEALIGAETVNTLPLETLAAYRDHGDPAPRLTEGVDHARHVLARLAAAGIDLDAVTQRLEDEGVAKFVAPFDSLMKTLEEKRAAAGQGNGKK
jgi:transaldolase